MERLLGYVDIPPTQVKAIIMGFNAIRTRKTFRDYFIENAIILKSDIHSEWDAYL
jgi:hypothetical protein